MTEHQYVLTGEPLREPYHYTGCGLDDVYLLNGYEVRKTAYGQGVTIKSIEDLHCAIGTFLVCHKKLLTGKELRFLRNQMDLTQSELGRLVGLSAQQVARWEKDQSNVNPAADRILRVLFKEHFHGELHVRQLLELLDDLDDRASEPHVFETTHGSWRAKAA